MPTSGLWQTNLPLLPALLLTTTLFGQTTNPHRSPPKSPTSESVEVQLGKCYKALKQDRYDDAEGNFRAASKGDPTLVMRAIPIGDCPFPTAQLHRSVPRIGIGSPRGGRATQDAEKWLTEAAKRNPQDSRAEYQLALLYKKKAAKEKPRRRFHELRNNGTRATN